MKSFPFAGLRPATDDRHAQWTLESLRPPPGVAFRVPPGFDAIIRIHHDLQDGRPWDTIEDVDDLRRATALPCPLPDDLKTVAGELSDEQVDLLVPVLGRSTESATLIHFAQWMGWGDLERGSRTSIMRHATEAARRENDRMNAERELAAEPIYAFVEQCPQIDWWGGRTMFLFDGPIEAVRTVGFEFVAEEGGVLRRCPQWWWPSDRSWFVASEIDDPCTYVSGTKELIREIDQLPLDTRRVNITDYW